MINPYLDTAIAVAVIYFVFSVLVSILQEYWAMVRESRGRMLRKAVYDLLNDSRNKGYGVLLFDHPQFNFLKKTENRLPAYLPAKNFASALIDIIAREGNPVRFFNPGEGAPTIYATPFPISAEEQYRFFITGLQSMNHSNLRILLSGILTRSSNLEALQSNLENWYDQYMDRVTGWYKNKVRINLRWIGCALAIVFNVHALQLISHIYSDRQLQEKMVAVGEQFSVAGSADSAQAKYLRSLEGIADSLNNWELPIGWKWYPSKTIPLKASGRPNSSLQNKWWWWPLGWILSGLAMAAGAPFWFEVLNKLVNVRRTGLKPKQST